VAKFFYRSAALARQCRFRSGHPTHSSAASLGDERRPDRARRRPVPACGFYSPVPPSASFALKGNCFSSSAMSRSEIAKHAGSTGGASGLRWSRFLSQSRIATRSSRNDADERLEKLVALLRVEPRPALHCGRTRSMARIAFPFEKRIGQTKHKKRKLQIC